MECGIDEAGRGSLLGPMVYASLTAPDTTIETLRQNGIADSKSLTKKKRERLYNYILSFDDIQTYISKVDADEITKSMNNGTSLNDIAFSCIKDCLYKFPSHANVYIDTVGNSDTCYSAFSPIVTPSQLVVASKADTNYTVVSAASIIAKVYRDRSIPSECGSGYPSDKTTQKWVKNNPQSTFIRHSWKTRIV
jgi:ribonuclease H